MNKLTKIALAASLLVGGIASTQACSLGAWDDNATSTSLAGGPAEAGANNFARYQGLCSMQTAGATPSVLNNGISGATSGPAGEASMIARFYFLPGAATGDIFTTYSDDTATTAVYTVSYAGGNVTVTPNGGGAPAVVAAGATNWHSVEVKWANSGGAIDVWVDTDATTAAADASTTSAATADTIEAGILGGTAGMIFDAYESRRTTSVGRLLVGDANNTGNISIADAVSIVNELGGVFTTGTPDCNESGNVSIADAICVVNLL
jgi:hypothetical protein